MFPYPGGKSKISKWIHTLFPTSDIDTYVEPFSGAFWTYCKWDQTPSNVVYNDLNKHLSNVFQHMSTDPERFAECMLRHKSEDAETYKRIQQDYFTSDFEPTLDKAIDFIYLQLHAFVGHQIHCTTRYQHIDTTKWSSRYHSLVRKLTNAKYQQRLKSITDVTNMSAVDVIKHYDSPTTVFYVDPPYWSTEHYYTEGQFNEQDHLELAQTLNNIEGMYALSYYNFPQLKEMYPDTNWFEKNFTSPMSAGAALASKPNPSSTKVDTSKHQKQELIITNYEQTPVATLEAFL